MGAFFTNIQLKNSHFDKSLFADKVIEYVIQLQLEQGYIKVDNEDDIDKTIIISTSNDLNWLSIYDEELEDEGIRKLNKLSSQLSKQFNTCALSVLVNDSESIYLGLNINGTLKDSLSNLSKEIDFNKSKPNEWSNLLVNNHLFEDIKLAWQNKSMFVESFLTEFAKLIDIDTSKLLTGYEYLSEEHPNEGIKLNFSRLEKKKVAELGLSKFSLRFGQTLLKLRSGSKQELKWELTNHGSESKGLQIVVAGKSIEDGSIIPETANISYYKQKPNEQNEFAASFVDTVTTIGNRVFYTEINDIDIPKGFNPTYPLTDREVKRYGKIWDNAALMFNINFIGLKPCHVDFKIYFTPLINRESGFHYQNIGGEISE